MTQHSVALATVQSRRIGGLRADGHVGSLSARCGRLRSRHGSVGGLRVGGLRFGCRRMVLPPIMLVAEAFHERSQAIESTQLQLGTALGRQLERVHIRLQLAACLDYVSLDGRKQDRLRAGWGSEKA